MMKTVGLTELRKKLDEYIDLAQKQPILITRWGRPVAVMTEADMDDAQPGEQLDQRLARLLDENGIVPFWRR